MRSTQKIAYIFAFAAFQTASSRINGAAQAPRAASQLARAWVSVAALAALRVRELAFSDQIPFALKLTDAVRPLH